MKRSSYTHNPFTKSSQKERNMEIIAMAIVLGFAMIASAIMVYAVQSSKKTSTLIKRDDGFCKCKDCKHIKECSAFVGHPPVSEIL